jgi:hypothetical protein
VQPVGSFSSFSVKTGATDTTMYSKSGHLPLLGPEGRDHVRLPVLVAFARLGDCWY